MLAELDSALAAAADADDRIRLLALKVYTLSRMYRPYESAASLEQVESLSRASGSPLASAWALFARGAHTYFTARFRESIAAFEASASLARDLDLPELNGLAYGAQAFSYLRVDELRNALQACLRVNALGESAGPLALYLMHVALGSMLQSGGDRTGALEHFAQALQHARQSGDTLAVAAMTARSAGIEAWSVRKEAARRSVGARSVARALANLEAAIDEALAQGTHAAISELQLLSGSLLMLQHRYAEAIARIEGQLEPARPHAAPDELVLAESDRARCMFELGHREMALAAARDALARSEGVNLPDVRAVALGNLAYMLWNQGATAEAEAVAAQAGAAWEAADARAAAALTISLRQIGDNPGLDPPS
jgi:hypothetical protein